MTNFYPLVGQVAFDYIECTYDGAGDLVTVQYFDGGSTGNIVVTLNMTYDGSHNVLTVTKTVL